MAYDSAYLGGPLYLGSKGGQKLWMLDTVDLIANVIASGYISDAFTRGMEKGDVIIVRRYSALPAKTTLNSVSMHYASAVVDGTGSTLSAAIGDNSGLTVLVGSGTASPDADLDSADGYSVGSLYIETDADRVWICVDNSSGAAIWKPCDNSTVIQMSALALDGTATKSLPAPFKFKITGAYSILSGALATGDATLQLKIGGTNVTNGLITITQSGSAANDVDSATPTAANTGAAGALIQATVGGTNTATETADLLILLEETQ